MGLSWLFLYLASAAWRARPSMTTSPLALLASGARRYVLVLVGALCVGALAIACC